VLTYGLVVLGVSDVRRAARFWCAALGYEVHPGPFGGFSTVLVPQGSTANVIALQPSATLPDTTHPRIHLDLHAPSRADQDAEAERLIQLGATRADWDSYPADPDFVVLADPDGNLFCVVDLSHEQASSSTEA
jgi:catechol 2,3-dioxygenase-like lactoylglutathione lyase family enzyme